MKNIELTGLQKWLLEKYGPTMQFKQVAECIGVEYQTARGMISADTFPVKSFKQGKLRLSNTVDVASYIESRSIVA